LVGIDYHGSDGID
jgi:hypothetical protein